MTTSTSNPTGRRAATTWVGATGAFLLVAAAAVFVAVRWDSLPESAKLALVGGLTGAFLVTGRRLQRTLPATGDVLFHLGAFLIPVDMAAACLRLQADWRVTLLVEGAVGVVAFGVLSRTTGSVVLGRAAALAIVVLAGGVAGVSPVPATLVLAAVAVITEFAGRGRFRPAAAAWAAIAGLAPALGAAATAVLDGTGTRIGSGTLVELGFAGRPQQLVAVLSGVLAAVVLANQAKARRDLRLAFLALASVAVGVGTSLTATHLQAGTGILGLAGLFVVLELVALLVYDDDFWGRPLAMAATVGEGVATLATVVAGLVLVTSPLIDVAGDFGAGDVTTGAALALVALGWLTADVRRVDPTRLSLPGALLRGAGHLPATLGVAIATVTAVQVSTFSAVATATALVAVAAGLVAAGRVGALPVAAVFGPWAVLTAATHPAAVAPIGIAAGLVIAVAAWRATTPHRAIALAADASATVIFASLLSADELGASAAVCLAAGGCWLVGVVLDRASVTAGDAARLSLLAVLAVAAGDLPPAQGVAPLAVVTLAYVLDAIRLRRPVVAFGAAAAVQPLIVALARASDLSLPWSGFALCIGAVVWCGLAAVIDNEWRAPFLAAAGAGLAVGLHLAVADAEALSNSLLVAGGVGVAAGVALRLSWLGHLGGVAATMGLAGHLLVAGVTASEPFVAPVALQLLVAGWQAQRRHQASSWVAYAPAVLLLGGAAFTERVAGGADGHALVAGAVGVAAVAIGGWRRLAGPMVVGTVLLVVLSGHESLSTLAGVPTWAWLAAGGSVLLGTAVLLERADASPLEAGRRVVEVLADRFD